MINPIDLEFVQKILDNTPIEKCIIKRDPIYQEIWNELSPILGKYKSEAKNYCQTRDSDRTTMNIWENQYEILKLTFEKYSVNVIPMSSFPNTHTNESDIDFGIIIYEDSTINHEQCKRILKELQFTFDGKKYDEYDSYIKFVDACEIEAKIRYYKDVTDIIKLHEKLDTMDRELHELITYGKLVLKPHGTYYDRFKGVVYSMYYTEICDKYQ